MWLLGAETLTRRHLAPGPPTTPAGLLVGLGSAVSGVTSRQHQGWDKARQKLVRPTSGAKRRPCCHPPNLCPRPRRCYPTAHTGKLRPRLSLWVGIPAGQKAPPAPAVGGSPPSPTLLLGKVTQGSVAISVLALGGRVTAPHWCGDAPGSPAWPGGRGGAGEDISMSVHRSIGTALFQRKSSPLGAGRDNGLPEVP